MDPCVSRAVELGVWCCCGHTQDLATCTHSSELTWHGVNETPTLKHDLNVEFSAGILVAFYYDTAPIRLSM